MTQNDDVRITPIDKYAPKRIIPSQPQIPEGQDRAPTRDANPRMSGPVTSNRLDTVRKGGLLQYRVHAEGRVSTWAPLAHEGETVELRVVDANPPQRMPYVIGT